VNLKELSRQLGLSQTTVSRALNGYPEVSETTRKRVQDLARRLNYSPNARARSLATGHAQAIGHVIPVSQRFEMVNPIFTDFLAGAAYSYAQAGFEMTLNLVENVNDPRVYQDIHARGNVDGVVVSAPLITEPRIALLTELGLPFVLHGRSSNETLPYSWVDTNNSRAFQRAAEFLMDLGHRRIALLNGHEDMDFAYRRRCGYDRALTERGLPVDPHLIMQDEMTESYGYLGTQSLLALQDPPTGILVSSMITAVGVRRALHDAGRVMGKDVSVIIHDDDLSALSNGHDVPIFTATRASARVAGSRTAEILLGLIREPCTPPQSHLILSLIHISEHTRPH